MRDRLGLYGGSFNPLHKGHLALIEAVQAELPCSPLFVMPTGIPPHKQAFAVAPHHRLAMTQAAVETVKGVVVSEFELGRPGPHYTVDTVTHLGTAYPGKELMLIMGSDTFLDLPRWYDWDRLKRLCTMVVGIRSGTDQTKSIEDLRHTLETDGTKVIQLKTPLPTVASSEVRRLLEDGDLETATAFLPERVASYLKKYNLYAKPAGNA